MTKTIKRSLIVVLMLVFAISAAFTATFAVKADEQLTPDQAADKFVEIVNSWDGKVDFDKKIEILTMVDGQYLIDSAAKAREMYADCKAKIDADATYADELSKYNTVMLACADALDFQAEINELGEALKVTSKVVIFGSEKLTVDSLEYKWNNTLKADEITYVESKFVNETVVEIIDAVQERIAGIYARGAVAAAAIDSIKTFDVDGEQKARLASEASLNAAIEKLTAIYGKTIEEIFNMDVRSAGNVYKEDATMVKLYVTNIEKYVALKAQYDAQVAIAEEVVAKIDALTEKVANTDAAYKFLANEEEIDALVVEFEALDSSANNNIKQYVTDKAGDKYAALIKGVYTDEIQRLVDLVLDLPKADAAGIIPLKEALDFYREQFEANDITDEQRAAVNATEISADSEYASYETIKNMYEFYNEKSTSAWAMVTYAINAIDAIPLVDGVFVMSVESIAKLVDAQKKYANVPETHKKYVTNSDKLEACNAKMDADLETIRVWANKVVAIKDAAPITVLNWKAVKEAVDYFESDAIVAQIRDYIKTVAEFRQIELMDGKKIEYFFNIYNAEVLLATELNEEIKAIVAEMDAIFVASATEDKAYAEIPAWKAYLATVKADYTTNVEFKHSDIVALYDNDAIKYLAEKYTTEYKKYVDALEIEKRYDVELIIEALTAPADVTILDEEKIVDARTAFDALVEENAAVLCGQDAVRNAEKLFACEASLKVITDMLDAFVAAVEALGDDATKLNLVAYNKAQNDRVALTLAHPANAIDEGYGPRAGINVVDAIEELDALRAAAIKNINELKANLDKITGNGQEFKDLYLAYMALDASQRSEDNEDILAIAIASVTETASIKALIASYREAGTKANTDWIYSVDGRLTEVKAELEKLIEDLKDASAKDLADAVAKIDAKIAELKEAIEANDDDIADLQAEIKDLEAKIAALESELKAADAELRDELASTRTLAIVALVIAIVGLCAAAFVIVYKVILKK